MKILLTGFLQVYFVVINTYFISNEFITGIFICSFLISFIWSLNVKKIAFGDLKTRIYYSLGASIGGTLGFLTSKYLIFLFVFK